LLGDRSSVEPSIVIFLIYFSQKPSEQVTSVFNRSIQIQVFLFYYDAHSADPDSTNKKVAFAMGGRLRLQDSDDFAVIGQSEPFHSLIHVGKAGFFRFN
jgi:hypothetical protein